jgi:putative DNA primase/helicase
MNHISEFRDAIAASGLTAPDNIIDDGKIHRFSSSGRKGDTAGWYILHGDGIPAGRFGCNRNTDIDVTWSQKQTTPLTDEQRAEYKRKMHQAKQARDAEQAENRARAADEAADLWARAVDVSVHPYLARKGIIGIGVRTIASAEITVSDKDNGGFKRIIVRDPLLVPLRHGPGALVGLQIIKPDGTKFFLNGTPSPGAYHVIGKPSKSGPIVIVEGYATAVSIHEATGFCCVVAISAGNLLSIARKIRAALPDAEIIMGADDDAWTDGNPGVTAATAAAAEIRARVVRPVWAGDRPIKHTDFNDLHADEGIEAVKRCFLGHNPDRNSDEPGAVSDKPFDKPASVDNNSGSSEAVHSFHTAGNAVQEPDRHSAPAPSHADDDPGPDVMPDYVYGRAEDHDDDIFIYSGTPLLTAQAYQDALPADGKVLFWRGEFYTWNGHRYVVRDKVFIHKELYRFMASCFTHKVDPKTGDREVVAFSPKRSNIEDVMHALTAVCYVDLDEPPTWIVNHVGDVPAGEIIAFRNGFLHWPTRRLLKSDPRLFVISALDFDYNPHADTPVEWLKFLSSAWKSDAESIEALADMFGYMLTDDTSQQKAFMMIGPPRCGKGTILRVLENLVGPHNRVSPSLASIGTQFGLQPLVGKRVAMISDARLSGKVDQQPIVENLLRITGEDALSVPRKYLGDWTGKLSTRFVLASNETPGFTDASAALANRFILFKFNTSFLGREDHGLTGRLLRELPGIVLWALAGLDRLKARGYLIQPESSRELADELRETSSPISEFVAEKCVVGEGYEVDRSELFEAWREWCKSQGMDHPGTMARFGKLLSATAPGIGRSQPRENGTRRNCYTNIKLRGVMDLAPGGYLDDEPPL